MKRFTSLMLVAVGFFLSATVWAADVETTPKLMDDIRQALTERQVDVEPAWVARVKSGQERGFLENTCEDLRDFNRKAWAFGMIREFGIKWEELRHEDFGLPLKETEARIALEKKGEQVVRAFEKVLLSDIPFLVREQVYCGDQLPDFADGVSIVEIMIRVLQDAGLEPTKIGLAEDRLRQLALEQFLLQIGQGRTLRKLSGNDRHLNSTIIRAMDEWWFTARDLDINSEEEEAVEQARKSAAFGK